MTRRERADAADAARHALAGDALDRMLDATGCRCGRVPFDPAPHAAGCPAAPPVVRVCAVCGTTSPGTECPTCGPAACGVTPEDLAAAVRRGLAEGGVPPAPGPGRLAAAADARAYALAGRATFTLRSAKTGTRFTYQVKASKDNPPRTVWWVAVLTGPENTADYEYLGTIFADGVFRRTKKSRIGEDAPSGKAFSWFWRLATESDVLPADLEVWHEGACGRCGRALTVPESVAQGLGPECAGIVARGGR